MALTYYTIYQKIPKPHSKRHFWQWLNLMFNQVDENRRKTVGPDRSCAEWLLRNGASVRWTSSVDYLSDYNSLPAENKSIYIRDVDATESSIMHYGFKHFNDCKHVESIIFHKCYYLEDSALNMLTPLSSTLKMLQISDCGNISQQGLLYLSALDKLQKLSLFDLINVKDLNGVIKELQNKLPSCVISHNDFRIDCKKSK